MPELRKYNWFDTITPLAASIIAALSLLAKNSVPPLVQVIAIITSLVLATTWLYSFLNWRHILQPIYNRRKLKKHLWIRTDQLIDETNLIMADSFTLSPFYVWHNTSNKLPQKVHRCHGYQWAIKAWLEDLSEKRSGHSLPHSAFIDSMSKLISELSKLAEYAERQIDEAIQSYDLSEPEKKEVLRQWDICRHHFNILLDSWSRLFGEVNRYSKTNCTTYFRRLGPVN